jgi:hypothetical protein
MLKIEDENKQRDTFSLEAINYFDFLPLPFMRLLKEFGMKNRRSRMKFVVVDLEGICVVGRFSLNCRELMEFSLEFEMFAKKCLKENSFKIHCSTATVHFLFLF